MRPRVVLTIASIFCFLGFRGVGNAEPLLGSLFEFDQYKDAMWKAVASEPCLSDIVETCDTARAEMIYWLHALHLFQYPLSEFCDVLDQKKSKTNGEILRMFDPFSRFAQRQPARNSQGKIGAMIHQVSGGTFVLFVSKDGPAQKAGLRSYDQIVKINGRPTASTISGVLEQLRGATGTRVAVTLLRDGVLISKTIQRSAWDQEFEFAVIGQVGYLRLYNFEKPQALLDINRTAFRKFLEKDIRAIILDFRGNPGGTINMAMLFLGFFQTRGTAFWFREPFSKNWFEGRSAGDTGNLLFAGVPLVVLVDQYTYSSAEMVAGSLRANRNAKIIGRNTGGKWAATVSIINHEGRLFYLTTEEWYLPDGRSVRFGGISPDIYTHPNDCKNAPQQPTFRDSSRSAYYLQDCDISFAYSFLLSSGQIK